MKYTFVDAPVGSVDRQPGSPTLTCWASTLPDIGPIRTVDGLAALAAQGIDDLLVVVAGKIGPAHDQLIVPVQVTRLRRRPANGWLLLRPRRPLRGRLGRSCWWPTSHPQYPPLDFGLSALGRSKVWRQPRHQSPAAIRLRQCRRHAKGVMLVAGSVTSRVVLAPQRWIDLGNDRSAGRRRPPIEGPEVDMIAELLPNEAKPRDTGMGGLCD